MGSYNDLNTTHHPLAAVAGLPVVVAQGAAVPPVQVALPVEAAPLHRVHPVLGPAQDPLDPEVRHIREDLQVMLRRKGMPQEGRGEWVQGCHLSSAGGCQGVIEMPAGLHHRGQEGGDHHHHDSEDIHQ